MAKNIDFMGAVFPDVPSVRLPQDGGGLVSFDDTTDATATADKILQGYTAYANGQKLTGTASGGITPSGTISITQNGQVDVTQYAIADVNVSGGGGGKNCQGVVGYSSVNSADIIAVPNMELTVAKTGTYNVGWVHVKTNGTISGASQLYINDIAYGEEKTNFNYGARANPNEDKNVSLNQGDVVKIYGRCSSAVHNVYVMNFIIQEQ